MKLRNNPEYSKATVAATEETLKIGLVSHLKTSFFFILPAVFVFAIMGWIDVGLKTFIAIGFLVSTLTLLMCIQGGLMLLCAGVDTLLTSNEWIGEKILKK
jgi:hypothetical protein